MITLVDLTDVTTSLEELHHELEELGKAVQVSITLQHEDVFTAMHRV